VPFLMSVSSPDCFFCYSLSHL